MVSNLHNKGTANLLFVPFDDVQYGMTSVDVGLALTGNAIAIALTHPIVGVLLDYGLSSIFLIFVGNTFAVLGLIGIGEN